MKHFQNYAADIGKHFEVTAFSPVPGQYACIFSDVTERKRAQELLKNTQKLDSSVPVFVVSGFAEDPIIANPQLYGFTASIPKPS